jgi:uncharacterized protein YegL
MNDLILYDKDLAENPTARIPICLVLDTSASMDGAPIEELNKGVKLFMEAILEDEMTRFSADISIVTFGQIVEEELKFGSIEEQETPTFYAGGLTPMGEAMLTSVELLDNRKKEYQKAGVDYFQPWLVIMSDGAPTDLVETEAAIKIVSKLYNDKKLILFPIGIGDRADMNKLSQFGRPAAKLNGLKFKEFFEWLSQSVSIVSQSSPGETITLDEDGIKSWVTIGL